MPIYEYLCPPCNRVYSFLAASPTADKEPVCPKCGATHLEKQVSRFAFVRSSGAHNRRGADDARGGGYGSGDFGGPDGPGDADDPKMERAMMQLMSEMGQVDENDPRQLGRMMRKMAELSGEGMEPEMEEAVRRLEAGEDPEKIEEDLGDFFGSGEEGGMGGPFGGPSHDDGLYPM